MIGSAKTRLITVKITPIRIVKTITLEKVSPASFRLPSPTFLTIMALPPVPIMTPAAITSEIIG